MRGLDPPQPVATNLYRMSPDELAEAGIARLPGTLSEALEEFRLDETVRQALGEHVAGKYLQAKLLEWDVYRSVVDKWELDQYLEKF
jgi:glutamine synthetase